MIDFGVDFFMEVIGMDDNFPIKPNLVMWSLIEPEHEGRDQWKKIKRGCWRKGLS